jgi:hypothetical protein
MNKGTDRVASTIASLILTANNYFFTKQIIHDLFISWMVSQLLYIFTFIVLVRILLASLTGSVLQSGTVIFPIKLVTIILVASS